jgi:hypothetical protein
MSRWSLALLVTLASPAFAQTPEPTAVEPVQAPPTAPAAPAAESKAPAPAAEDKAPAPAPTTEAKPPAPAPTTEAKPPAPAPAAEAAPTAPAPEPKAEPAASAAEAKPPPSPPAAAPQAPATAPAPAAKAPPAAPVPAPAAPAAPAPEPKPQVAQPTPTAPPPPTATSKEARAEISPEELKRKHVRRLAGHILEDLLTGNVRGATNDLIFPFQLEDKRYATPEELVAAWVKQLRVKRTDLVILYDIEVLSMPEMEKKYGKPPARLGLGNLRDPNIYAAVANLSGRAAVLLFLAPPASTPRAFAYTD